MSARCGASAPTGTAVRARALSLNVLRHATGGLPDADDVGAVLVWLGDVAALTASGDRCALRELASKLTGLYAGPQRATARERTQISSKRAGSCSTRPTRMNWRRQAALVDMFGRRPGDLDDLAALPEVLRPGAPGFRFYASVALAALDVPCVSFDHLRLVRRRRRRSEHLSVKGW